MHLKLIIGDMIKSDCTITWIARLVCACAIFIIGVVKMILTSISQKDTVNAQCQF